MSGKTTLALFLALFVVAIVCWYAGVFAPTDTTKPSVPVVDAAKHLLVTPKLKDVTKVRIEHETRGHLVFEKNDSDWLIVDPIHANAVSWEATDLVSAVTAAKVLNTFTPGQDGELTLEQTGLADPQTKITLEADRTVTLLVGKNVVASENTYVKLADSDQVAIVDVNYRSRIKRDLKEYRDKQLWELKKDKITELTYLHRDGTKHHFTKSDGRWLMLAPVRARADKDAVTKAIDTLAWLKAEEFVDDNPERLDIYGLKAPTWTITVVTTETIQPKTGNADDKDKPASTQPTIKRTETTLLVGSTAGLGTKLVYAKPADHKWVIGIKPEDFEKFTPDLQTWRDKKLIDVPADDFTRIEVTGPDGKVVLTKQDDLWQLQTRDDTLVDVDTGAVDTLRNTVADLQVASFIDNPDKKITRQFQRPTYEIRITATEKLDPITVSFGKLTPSGLYRYVKRSGLDFAAAVAEEKLADLVKPALAYRNRQMLNFGLDDVVEITLARGKRTYTLTRPRGGLWTISGPVAAPADPDTVKDLILACNTLAAEKLVAEGQLKRFGLDHPDITLTITAETEVTTTTQATQPTTKKHRQTHTLRVAKKADTVHAATAESDLVAQVPASLYNDLTAELITRDLFTEINADQATRLEIQRGKTTLRFLKKDNAWQYPHDPLVQIDPEKIKSVVKALADLKAKRYVAFTAQQTKNFVPDKPYMVVTVDSVGKTYQLTVGRTSDAGRYARTSTRNEWTCELKTADLDKLNKQLKEFTP